MSFHLAQAKHCILTFGAMVMGLFPIVRASTHRTVLSWGVLFKACSHDGIKLLVLPAMGHYLVGVCAIIVTFQAVKMAAGLLSIPGHWNCNYKILSLEKVGP